MADQDKDFGNNSSIIPLPLSSSNIKDDANSKFRLCSCNNIVVKRVCLKEVNKYREYWSCPCVLRCYFFESADGESWEFPAHRPKFDPTTFDLRPKVPQFTRILTPVQEKLLSSSERKFYRDNCHTMEDYADRIYRDKKFLCDNPLTEKLPQNISEEQRHNYDMSRQLTVLSIKKLEKDFENFRLITEKITQIPIKIRDTAIKVIDDLLAPVKNRRDSGKIAALRLQNNLLFKRIKDKATLRWNRWARLTCNEKMMPLFVIKRKGGPVVGWVPETKDVIYLNGLTKKEIDDIQSFIEGLASDPAATIANVGKLLGACCLCGQLLSTENSKRNGYGDICAVHFTNLGNAVTAVVTEDQQKK